MEHPRSRSIKLFGPPQVTLDGETVHVARKKAIALAAYLLLTDVPVSRDHLCELCWPHLAPSRARGSLRTTLAHVRELLSPQALVADREHVHANRDGLFVDVREFLEVAHALSGRADLRGDLGAEEIERAGAAAELYRGEFMAGFFLSGCPGFDAWQMEMADHLRRLERDLLWTLATFRGEAGETDRAVDALRRLLVLDPLDEQAHRELMVLFHEHGDRSAARRQYDRCAALMQHELGRPPEEETTELAREIERATPVVRDSISSARALLPHHEIRYVTILIAGPDPERRARSVLCKRLSHLGATVHDGIDEHTVVLFGGGSTHEDDPERATIAALELRETCASRDAPCAVAVRTGPLLIATNHHEPPVGPLLNLAYRQLFHTEPGDISICRQTYRRVHRQIDCEPLAVQGDESARLGPTWRVLDRRPGGAILTERTTPFAGRQSELQTLAHALAAPDPEAGNAAMIEGEPGIGKSRLVLEARDRLQEARPEIMWFTLACFERQSDATYECARPFLRTLVATTSRIGIGSGPHALVDSMVSRGSIEFARSGAVTEAIRSLAEDSTRAQAGQSDRPLRVDQFHAACESAFAGLLALLLERGPIVLHVEDLHWADPATATVVAGLAARFHDRGLRMVLTYRRSELGAVGFAARAVARAYRDRATTIALDRLPPEAVEQIVRAGREGAPRDDRTVAAIARRSDGNPFFALELARWSGASGDDQSRSVPLNVARVIQRRADSLTPDARSALRTAAVAGEEALWDTIIRATAASSEPDAILDELVGAGFINRRAVFPETIVGFTHSLFPDALYASIPPDEAVRLHGRVADAMETRPGGERDETTRMLAYHHHRAGHHEPAARHLIRRGDQLRNRFDFDGAIASYSDAVAHIREHGTTRQLRECWLRIASCHDQRLDHDAAQEAFREAFALPPERSTAPVTRPARADGEGVHWFFLQRAPVSLDPLQTPNLIAFVIHRQIYRPLVRYTYEQIVEPDAAAEWESSPDGLSYRFTIRDDASWSDGAPIVAADYAYAIRSSMTLSTVDWGYQTIPIAGRSRFLDTGDPGALAIRTPESRVLEFDLETPAPFLLHVLGVPYMGAHPTHRMRELGRAWSEPANSVSSGPLRIEEFVPGTKIRMVRNERYTGRFTGNIVEAGYTFGANDELLRGFVRNEFDTAVLDELQVPEAYRVAPECVLAGPSLATVCLAVSARSESLRYGELRQALAHAIDRHALARDELGGYHFAGTGGTVPPGVLGHRDQVGLPYDPVRAAELASAWPQHVERRLRLVAGDEDRPAGRAVAERWRETLGVDVEVRRWPDGVGLRDLLGSNECDVAMVYARSLVPDPIAYFELAAAGGDESIRERIAEIERVAEFRTRISMTRDLDREIVEDAWCIPLYYPRGYIVSKPWVQNLVVMPFYHGGPLDAVVGPHPRGGGDTPDSGG